MNKVIFDASALLALIKNEAGAKILEGLLGNVMMSSINVSEVLCILLDSDMNVQEVKGAVEPFIDFIIPFDFEHSISCAALKKATRHLGLSLGDRACIALGMSTGYPVYTADKAWGKLELDCKIILIR